MHRNDTPEADTDDFPHKLLVTSALLALPLLQGMLADKRTKKCSTIELRRNKRAPLRPWLGIRGVYSFVTCLGRLAIDHACLSKWSMVQGGKELNPLLYQTVV